MKKISFLITVLGMIISTSSFSENLFWFFDDNQLPMTIPPECEFKFDEVHGGVFMPTIDDLVNYGQQFLHGESLTVQQQGAYCILGAALQNHAPSQLTLAKLYEEGKILPQSDLNAYKWAFLAAANGQKEAERLTLLLEQYLTTPELKMAYEELEKINSKIQEALKKQQEENQKDEKSQTDTIPPQLENNNNPIPNMDEVMPDINGIFTEQDRIQ